MISSKYFIETLKSNQIDFFTGVPDSLLKNICAYIADHSTDGNNIIAANEGAAIALAAGYYLATGNIPVVYMQNSGIGNAVNPLMSLIDRDVYNIPLLLLIGWRGEPGVKDEPQHIKQGKVTIPMLDAMNIKNVILSQEETFFEKQLQAALSYIYETNEPFAFVIQKNTFAEYAFLKSTQTDFELKREDAIQLVAASMREKDIAVSTTGMISRELFEYREAVFQNHGKDFLTVGSMGHASQIALGIALQKKDRRVYCFDGDGAILMHMGALPIIGVMKPNNYIHVVFNNGAHDSVGGQPTVGLKIELTQIALASGYTSAFSVVDEKSLLNVLDKIENDSGCIFLEIKVKKGARKDLGRPFNTPEENKRLLMDFLKR